jgi:hypothetical protein
MSVLKRQLRQSAFTWMNVGIGACTFSHARAWCKNSVDDVGVDKFTCCLTRDYGSRKYLRMRSYILSNAYTWFSG